MNGFGVELSFRWEEGVDHLPNRCRSVGERVHCSCLWWTLVQESNHCWLPTTIQSFEDDEFALHFVIKIAQKIIWHNHFRCYCFPMLLLFLMFVLFSTACIGLKNKLKIIFVIAKSKIYDGLHLWFSRDVFKLFQDGFLNKYYCTFYCRKESRTLFLGILFLK